MYPTLEGRRSELCRLLRHFFESTGRGTVGKVGLRAGRRYQEGKGRRAGRSSTQRNTTKTDHIKAQQHPYVHACGSHETQLDTDNIHPLGI